MKLIIAGSSHLRVSFNFLKGICSTYGIPIDKVTEIVCGESDGIDTCGRKFGERLGINIKSFTCPDHLGKPDRHFHNVERVKYGDGLILIWNAHSTGAANLKFVARQKGIPIWEVILANPPTKKEQKEFGWINDKDKK